MGFRKGEARARQGLPAIANVDRSGDIRGRIGTKKQREIGKLVFGSVAPERDRLLDLAANLLVGRKTAHAFGVGGGARSDAVGANSGRAPFDGQRSRKKLDAGLGGANVRLVGDGNGGVAGRD